MASIVPRARNFAFYSLALWPIQPAFHHVRLYHTHTNEHIDVAFRRGNRYVPQGLATQPAHAGKAIDIRLPGVSTEELRQASFGSASRRRRVLSS